VENDPTPEIEIGSATMSKLRDKSCFVCRKIVKDLEKDKMILVGSKDIPLVGKLAHLHSEFGIEPKGKCESCKRDVPLRLFSEDFSACIACTWDPASSLPDDKKWATV
jgi:hypothetical protein